MLHIYFLLHGLDETISSELTAALTALDQDWYVLHLVDCPDRTKFLQICKEPPWNFILAVCQDVPDKIFSIGRVGYRYDLDAQQAGYLNLGRPDLVTKKYSKEKIGQLCLNMTKSQIESILMSDQINL